MSQSREAASSAQGAASHSGVPTSPLHEALDQVARSAPASRLHTVLLERLAERTQAVRASLMLLNPVSGRLRFAAAIGLPADLLGQDVPVRARSISDWVYRNRRGVIVNGEVQDKRFEGSAPQAGIGSALCVPVLGGGGILGVLNLARIPPAPVFTDAEMQTIEHDLHPVALRLEAIEAERAAGSRGTSLETLACGAPVSRVPRGASDVRALQIGFAHVPGHRLGGDVCDRAPHPSGGHAFLVADVRGGASPPIAIGALVQGLFVGLASTDRSPQEIAMRLNAELHARLPGAAVAAWIAYVSPNGQVDCCNAGYPAPLWIPADDVEPHALAAGGPLLGAANGAAYEQESLRLLPGDTLLLASDGILGARDNAEREFGVPGLLEVVAEQRKAAIERLVERLCAVAASHAAHARPLDDLTALALRYTRED